MLEMSIHMAFVFKGRDLKKKNDFFSSLSVSLPSYIHLSEISIKVQINKIILFEMNE